MPTVMLVRHGRTKANASGLLAGRTPGVSLDDTGVDQARRAGDRLSALTLSAAITSPMQRCQETARAILAANRGPIPMLQVEPAIDECDYGDWQNRPLKELVQEDLWPMVQRQPSAVRFPGGETMSGMQARAVAAIREHDAAVAREHGHHAVWLAVSHGDIIKSIVADALGTHLDQFQRIVVSPASVCVIRFGAERPEVLAVNTFAGDLAWAAPPRESATADSSAEGVGTVGGGDSPDA